MMIILHLLSLLLLLDLTWSLGNDSTEVTELGRSGSRGNWIQVNTRNCWYSCGRKGGLCENFCGDNGYCCRKGYSDCPNEARFSRNRHTCSRRRRPTTPGNGFGNWIQVSTSNCWYSCGRKGGRCENVCGDNGYCCRKGYSGCPNRAGISTNRHTCIRQTDNGNGLPRCDPTTQRGYIVGGNNVVGAGACRGCSTSGQAECKRKCDYHPDCAGWTLQTATSNCWLKVEGFTTNNGADGWQWGKSCKDGALRMEGQSCGPCQCPPSYTAGQCEEGLECVKDPHLFGAALADSPGKCQQPGADIGGVLKKEGQSCGPCQCPPSYTAGQCEEGLECVKDPHLFGPSLADSPGKCQRPLKKEGESCGSCFCPPSFTAGECDQGLRCVKNSNIPDLPGKCQRHFVGSGRRP